MNFTGYTFAILAGVWQVLLALGRFWAYGVRIRDFGFIMFISYCLKFCEYIILRFFKNFKLALSLHISLNLAIVGNGNFHICCRKRKESFKSVIKKDFP